MIDLTVQEAVRAAGGRLICGDPGAPIRGFSIDSRGIKAGEFFIAVKGERFDGHDFIGEAGEKGAAGLVTGVGRHSDERGVFEHIIEVEDTTRAMGDIARAIRRKLSIPVVCVTGTNGKTTVKDMLAHLLSAEKRVLASERSYNNIIGLSLTLFGAEAFHDAAVLEIGSNHPGEIAALAGIASPDIAVITNIGRGHLEYFSDRGTVFREKMSLVAGVPDTGTVFLNGDDDMLSGCGAAHPGGRFFGTARGSDILISDVCKEEEGYGFSLNGRPFHLPLEGAHNVNNAAAAVAVAEYIGMGYVTLRERLKGVSLQEMRLEKIREGNILFINDAYNANPDSFECALDVLDAEDGGKKIVVAGDMMELGDKSDELHRELGRDMARRGLDLLITIGEKAAHAGAEAVDAGMDPDRVLRAADHAAAAEIVHSAAEDGAVVLLKGSRVSRMEEVIRCFTSSCTR